MILLGLTSGRQRRTMMKHLKNPPLVMSGLALGTLSLGNLLASYFSLFSSLGLLASPLYLWYLSRWYSSEPK